MTLIAFAARIHFAVDVLEEALRAEIDAGGYRSLLVLSDGAAGDGEVAARVHASLPVRCAVTTLALGGAGSAPDAAARALDLVDPSACDGVIAFGSAQAIAFGRTVRRRIAMARYARITASRRKRLRERDLLPDFIAIPGIDGLPSPCRAASVRPETEPPPLGRAAPPTVVICDPSVAWDASDRACSSAWANALGRCIEALASPAFNPPADGLAIEGLRRAALAGPGPAPPRERAGRLRDLMAAGLNAALAQSKGPGLIQAIGDEVDLAAGRHIDGGALWRILLPRVTAEPGFAPAGHAGLVREILRFAPGIDFAEGLEGLFADLPLARALGALGLTEREVSAAAETLATATDVPLPPPERLGAILRASL